MMRCHSNHWQECLQNRLQKVPCFKFDLRQYQSDRIKTYGHIFYIYCTSKDILSFSVLGMSHGLGIIFNNYLICAVSIFF